MANFGKDFTTWAASGAVLNLTVGTDLLLGKRPYNAPDLCTVILEPPGGQSEVDLPAHHYPVLQLLTRGKDYPEARAEAERIHDILHGTIGEDISANYFVFGVEAIGVPGDLGMDAQNRYLVNTFFRVRYEAL